MLSSHMWWWIWTPLKTCQSTLSAASPSLFSVMWIPAAVDALGFLFHPFKARRWMTRWLLGCCSLKTLWESGQQWWAHLICLSLLKDQSCAAWCLVYYTNDGFIYFIWIFSCFMWKNKFGPWLKVEVLWIKMFSRKTMCFNFRKN